MDADIRESFAASIRATLDRVPADRVVDTIMQQGWIEAFDEDPQFMVSCLFEEVGRRVSRAPVLDLLATAPGSRHVLPRSGCVTPGTSNGKLLEIDGLALGAGTPGSYLVAMSEHVDARDERATWVAEVPAELVHAEPCGGLDPDLGVHRVHGQLTLRDVSQVAPSWPGGLLRRALGHLLVGLADRAAADAREYVLKRTQFGRPIGSWQTVQHRLAEVHVQTCAARAALDVAWRDPRPLASAVAKHESAIAAREGLTHAQQLFGAIGFTWEHGLHHMVRRWQTLDLLLGSSSELAHEIGSELLRSRRAEPGFVVL